MSIEPMGPVVVGVDGSAESLAALDLAAEEAVGRVVPLVIVHASDGPAGGSDVATRLVGTALSRAWAEHPGLAADTALVSGEAADALVDSSRWASLLVVGHRARCGGRAVARSVAHAVVGRAGAPVVVHHPLEPVSRPGDRPRPVLVGVANAPSDDPVVEFAFAEASLRGAAVHALHIEPACGYARDDADRMMVDALRAWSEKHPEVKVRRIVRHGLDVPVALTAASRSAQLVVVGSRQDGGTGPGTCVSMVSVAQVLVHRAGCPVVAVPAG